MLLPAISYFEILYQIMNPAAYSLGHKESSIGIAILDEENCKKSYVSSVLAKDGQTLTGNLHCIFEPAASL